MTHLQNEVQAVQKRRQAFSDEIKAETARLLVEREQQLISTEITAKKRLKELGTELATARDELVTLAKRKPQYEEEILVLQRSADALQGDEQSLSARIDALTRSLTAKEQHQVSVESRIQALEGDIDPLKTLKSELETATGSLGLVKASLEEQIVETEAEYAKKKATVEADISDLLSKQQSLEVAQANMLTQYNQMSEDIAARTKALDDREGILKRREYKVNIDERRVASNAELLQL